MCPTHLILLDWITRIKFGDKYTSLNSSLFILPHSPVTQSLLGPNNLLSALFSNTSAYVPPSLSVTKLHTHKATGKTIVLYILIFKFWIANTKLTSNVQKIQRPSSSSTYTSQGNQHQGNTLSNDCFLTLTGKISPERC